MFCCCCLFSDFKSLPKAHLPFSRRHPQTKPQEEEKEIELGAVEPYVMKIPDPTLQRDVTLGEVTPTSEDSVCGW